MQAILVEMAAAGPAAVVSEVVARVAAARAAAAVPEAHLRAALVATAKAAEWRVAAGEAAERRVVEAAPEGRLKAIPEREEAMDNHQVEWEGAEGRAAVAEDGEEAVEVAERSRLQVRVAVAAVEAMAAQAAEALAVGAAKEVPTEAVA